MKADRLVLQFMFLGSVDTFALTDIATIVHQHALSIYIYFVRLQRSYIGCVSQILFFHLAGVSVARYLPLR